MSESVVLSHKEYTILTAKLAASCLSGNAYEPDGSILPPKKQAEWAVDCAHHIMDEAGIEDKAWIFGDLKLKPTEY